jgi:hypothetical protein
VKECREREKAENYDGDEEEYRCHMGKGRGALSAGHVHCTVVPTLHTILAVHRTAVSVVSAVHTQGFL